jgi:hypothetical protein
MEPVRCPVLRTLTGGTRLLVSESVFQERISKRVVAQTEANRVRGGKAVAVAFTLAQQEW